MGSTKAAAISTVGAICASWAAVALCSSVSAAPQGAAVVINADLAPRAQLPALDDVRADIGRVGKTFRAAGLRTAADPTRRCLAVTAPPQITDADLLRADQRDSMLAAGILERTTAEQIAARQKGYLRMEALSATQRAAALRIAKRDSMVDERGRPKEKGTHLSAGIWQSWLVHVSTYRNGQGDCFKLWFDLEPPTEPAVASPPLSGSVLWWAWPHAEAGWGDEPVTIPAGRYVLRDLLAELSRVGKLEITAGPEVSKKHLAVVAEGTPVRTLLWAIEVATGAQVRNLSTQELPVIRVASDRSPRPAYGSNTNVLASMSGFGYYSPTDSAAGRRWLSRLEGGPVNEDAYWIGWRLSDLPLLHRNQIEALWQRSHRVIREKTAPPLDPDHTFVLWTKAVLVSVSRQHDDGSGGGPEFPLSAL